MKELTNINDKNFLDYTNSIINNILHNLNSNENIYIDIGSSHSSNLTDKLIRESYKTIFIEMDKQKASNWSAYSNLDNFTIINDKATPINIVNLLSSHIKQKEITFIDIDIDGYDYYVLESILNYKKPYAFMAEINEKIPCPIKFTVKYDENYSWDGSHFYGMSISQIYLLTKKYGYDIVDLVGNNIFCIRNDKNYTSKSLSDIDAFNIGYKNPRLNNQLSVFSYNSNVDNWLSINTEEALQSINSYFNKYSGKYIINL